ncbi:MAG TPA: serine protease [Streptosporangiaceae bacterium]|nr:serine protease [Streptosporangiaceae bacterium]
MSSVPLAARVVEVIADRGDGCSPRYRCGSGIIVAGRTVLTAAHVVTGAVNVVVRGPDKVALQATADPAFTGDPDGPGPDLALVEVVGGRLGVPAIGLAAVARDSPAGDPVERCHVIGYPAFMERETAGGGRFRETADALGQVPVLSGLAGGLLSVQVSSSPRPLPPARAGLADSPWSGMSGSPVIAGGLLLGVVTEHAPRAGSSAITATPLTALDPDPEHPGWGPGVADPPAWWARLGVAGPGALTRLTCGWWATRGRVRPRCWPRPRRRCRETSTSPAISCPAVRPTRTAGGSWPRWSLSWPPCWTKTRQPLTCSTSGLCGTAPRNPSAGPGTWCWSWTAWTRTCALPGCPASRRCCPPWRAGTSMSW